MSAALDSDRMLELVWQTLKAWGIGIRASQLLDLPGFREELRRHHHQMDALDGPQLGAGGGRLADAVWSLIDDLRITPNKSRLVATTKTLHHLLPDLVPPIDRAYTGEFFGWAPNEFQDRQEDVFRATWRGFVAIAVAVEPERFVDGTPWHTSATKVIDNAIVGYCLEHDLGKTSKPLRRMGSMRTKQPIPKGPWNTIELRDLLSQFEDELQQAGLKENSVQTYVGRTETFIRWLEGNYHPRGPNQT